MKDVSLAASRQGFIFSTLHRRGSNIRSQPSYKEGRLLKTLYGPIIIKNFQPTFSLIMIDSTRIDSLMGIVNGVFSSYKEFTRHLKISLCLQQVLHFMEAIAALTHFHLGFNQELLCEVVCNKCSRKKKRTSRYLPHMKIVSTMTSIKIELFMFPDPSSSSVGGFRVM